MPLLPLKGLKILVTRPRAQGPELARLMKARGARVVCAPAIRLTAPSSCSALDAALKNLSSFDALVFTSVNGVERFFDRARRKLGKKPLAPRRLYAIGPRTAKALRDHGWSGVRVPEKYEGAALARRLGGVKGLRILIPRAKIARDVLPKALAERGAAVTVVEAYRTVADRAGQRALRRAAEAGDVDWVTFTSSSTVEQFFAALDPVQTKKLLDRARAASIGPVTSAALRGRGIEPAAEARRYTAAGLVAALIRTERTKKR